jgi:predicted amidohydrolase
MSPESTDKYISINLSSYRVAGVQMDIVPGEWERNRDHAASLVQTAIDRDAQLIVCSELCDIDEISHAWELATPAPGPFTLPFEQLAAENGVHIVVGMARRTDDGYYNSAVFIGPQGIVGAYDKVHGWSGSPDEDPRRIEPHNFLPGDGFTVFDIDGISVGALICYDGMFAESWQCLRLLGADLVVWPTNRDTYGDTSVVELARFYHLNIIAVNRFGQSTYWTRGDSQIVSARGKVLAHAYNGESVLIADLDIAGDRQWRRRIPYIRDRRPDVYDKYLHLRPEAEVSAGPPSYCVEPLWRSPDEADDQQAVR